MREKKKIFIKNKLIGSEFKTSDSQLYSDQKSEAFTSDIFLTDVNKVFRNENSEIRRPQIDRQIFPATARNVIISHQDQNELAPKIEEKSRFDSTFKSKIALDDIPILNLEEIRKKRRELAKNKNKSDSTLSFMGSVGLYNCTPIKPNGRKFLFNNQNNPFESPSNTKANFENSLLSPISKTQTKTNEIRDVLEDTFKS